MPDLGEDPTVRWEPALAHYFPGTMPWTLWDLTRDELGAMLDSIAQLNK